MNETLTLGYALCGSFCTFEKSLQALEALSGRYANIIPIFSEASATLDTRFGRATEHMTRAEQICGRPALRSLTDAEPIGPKKLLDLLILAPPSADRSGGFDTLARLRARTGLADVPAVLMADDTGDESRESARATNTHLLARPLRPSRLRALMNRLFGADDGDGAQRSGIG